jgi:uncharacterized protein YhjY with autotransporter beta-barrel domain
VVKGMAIIYTSSPSFVGTATIVYALSNAYGTTQGVATVTVAGRLDPSKDPEVGGLLAAQADATRRFASSQLDNFNRRLESLHGGGWGKSNFSLGLNSFGVQSRAEALNDPLTQLNAAKHAASTMATGRPASLDGAVSGRDGVRQGSGMFARNGNSNISAASASSFADTGTASAPSLPTLGSAASESPKDSSPRELSLWVGGSIDFGQRDALTGQERLKFHTDGLSLGADYRISDLWSVGVGGGFGTDSSDVGGKGSSSSGRSSVLAVYGSLRPAEHVFVDGVLGFSALSFDLNRFITDTRGFATGHRSGSQWFGSLSAGYEHRSGSLLLSPYARLDLMNATLKGYTESAADVSALSYADQAVRMSTGKLGLRAETAYALSTGELQPRGRVEYQHHFEGADNATMSYADLGSAAPVYSVQPQQAKRSMWMTEVGGKWVLRRGLAVSLDYGSSISEGSGMSHSIRFGLEGKF